MQPRTQFKYKVQLQRNDGQILERDASVYWDPQREGAAELVATSVAAMTTVAEPGQIKDGQRQFSYAGLTAILQP